MQSEEVRNMRSQQLGTVLLTLAAMSFLACATSPSERGPRLYVFDCGQFTFDDIAAFGLTNEETPVRDLFVPCYLIEHAGGRLVWDGGLPMNFVGQGDVEMQPGMHARYKRSFADQLADLGLTPADVDTVAFSHMHFDHVGIANLFPHARLLIQRTEHVAAFERADENDFFDRQLYASLANAETVLLDGDHDVFGDGSVELLSAPGHTPGHQVLFLDLAVGGPLILSGDLYHFQLSRREQRVPAFNTDRDETLRSMERIEAIVKERGARFWIEHDQALADTLNLVPAYYD
jgi:N-acyl homoserine lactone hydrolase